jgi:hypothetical protein
MTAAVLIVAAVTYLLTSARSSRIAEAPSAATPARDAASAKDSGATLSDDPLAAPQTSAPPEKRDHRTWMRELAEALVHRGDAHSLAAVALLMNANAADLSDPAERRDVFRGRVLDLLHRAATAAPADATLQSLALVFCRDPAYQIAGCDPQPYEEALTAIDPTNGWAVTGELRRANSARNPAQQAAAIARMARSPRIDTHRVEIETLFANAIQSVPVAPDDRAGQDAVVPARRLTTGAMNAAAVDALDAVATACERPSQGEARENCFTVARLLRNSSDPILADQGFTLARQLAPPGSATAAELATEKRREDWQIAAFLRMPRTPEQNARFVRERIPSAQLRREVLLENGVPLDPPPDWPSP